MNYIHTYIKFYSSVDVKDPELKIRIAPYNQYKDLFVNKLFSFMHMCKITRFKLLLPILKFRKKPNKENYTMIE